MGDDKHAEKEHEKHPRYNVYNDKKVNKNYDDKARASSASSSRPQPQYAGRCRVCGTRISKVEVEGRTLFLCQKYPDCNGKVQDSESEIFTDKDLDEMDWMAQEEPPTAQRQAPQPPTQSQEEYQHSIAQAVAASMQTHMDMQMQRMEQNFMAQLAARDQVLERQVRGLQATQQVVTAQHQDLNKLQEAQPSPDHRRRKVRVQEESHASGLPRRPDPAPLPPIPTEMKDMTFTPPHQDRPTPVSPAHALSPGHIPNPNFVPLMDVQATSSIAQGLEAIVSLDQVQEEQSDASSVMSNGFLALK